MSPLADLQGEEKSDSSTCPPTKLNCTYLPTSLPPCLPACLPAFLPACLPACLPTYPPTRPPTHPSLRPSVSPSIRPFVHRATKYTIRYTLACMSVLVLTKSTMYECTSKHVDTPARGECATRVCLKHRCRNPQDTTWYGFNVDSRAQGARCRKKHASAARRHHLSEGKRGPGRLLSVLRNSKFDIRSWKSRIPDSWLVSTSKTLPLAQGSRVWVQFARFETLKADGARALRAERAR